MAKYESIWIHARFGHYPTPHPAEANIKPQYNIYFKMNTVCVCTKHAYSEDTETFFQVCYSTNIKCKSACIKNRNRNFLEWNYPFGFWPGMSYLADGLSSTSRNNIFRPKKKQQKNANWVKYWQTYSCKQTTLYIFICLKLIVFKHTYTISRVQWWSDGGDPAARSKPLATGKLLDKCLLDSDNGLFKICKMCRMKYLWQ